MTHIFKLILPALILFSMPALAVNIAEDIPSIEAQDQNGNTQNFESLKGKKGAILVFVRSVDWCPYCQSQLIDLGSKDKQITDLGYNLIAISYDSVESQKKFSDKHNFKYPLLSDTGSQIIKSFEILNEDMDESSSYYGVPHPTIYVVDADGKISNTLSEEGYKKRPPAEAIIDAIKK